MAKRSLGKGLDVLIGSVASREGQRLEEIGVKDIRPNPRQPRKRFGRESLEGMARSIETLGIVQPVIVRHVGTEYELIVGERRWRAAEEAGLEKIPAVVRDSTETDSLEIALIENLHRDDLNGIEEATAYQQLLEDFGITHEELSRRVGKSRAAITNTLRLLQLPPHIQRELIEENISSGHARALLALQDKPELQDKLCSRIIREGLSVRQAEGLAGSEKAEDEPRAARARERVETPEEAQTMFRRLGELLEARIKGSFGKRKGRLVIEFRDMADLQRIFETITGSEPGREVPVEELSRELTQGQLNQPLHEVPE